MSKHDTKAEENLAKKVMLSLGGVSRRAWCIGVGVLLLFSLLLLFGGGNAEKTVYTDGKERQPEGMARLRQVVWTSPTMLFQDADVSVDRYDPAVTDGGLTLVFVAGLPEEGADLFIVTRRKPNEEWGEPQPLEALNTDSDELGPAFSSDGQFLFFSSDRAGGKGGYDIWVAKRDDDQWSKPVNLGEGIGENINTPFDEIDPFIRRPIDVPGNTGENLHPAGLYFTSNQPADKQPDSKLSRWRGTARAEYQSQRGNYDIFLAQIKTENLPEEPQTKPEAKAEVNSEEEIKSEIESSPGSKLQRKEGVTVSEGNKEFLNEFPWFFTQPQRLKHLNTNLRDAMPSVTQLGDYVYFSSNRQIGEGGFDIFSARWHPDSHRVPSNIGPPLNTAANETDPVLYSHGHEMIFSSDRGAGEAQTFQLFHSHTTEVIPIVEVAQVTPRATGSFWHYLHEYKWWILLLLLALLALLALLKNFLSEEKRRTLSLVQRCLLGSIALHSLLAFLLSVWVLSHAVYKTIKEEQVLELAINESDAAIQQMSQEIREVVPNLPQAQPDLTTEQAVVPASAVVQPPADTSRPVEVQQKNKPNAFAVQPKQVQPMPIHPETLSAMTRPPVLPDQTTSAKPSKQDQGEAKAQASRALTQASAQAKVSASQTQNVEVNPQTTEAENVKAEQAAKMTAAQTANPVDAKKQEELVEVAQTQNNLPKLETVRSESKQDQGEAKAQDNQHLQKATQLQLIKVATTSNQTQSQPNFDAVMAKAVDMAQQVAKTTVTNVAPIRLSAAARLLNTAPRLPATAPVMAATKITLEQVGPQAKTGQGLLAANKISALQAAKGNMPKLVASTNAKATGPINNMVAKNVLVESAPISARVRMTQVQATKMNAVLPELQVAKVRIEELEAIDPTVSAEKRLSRAQSKQTIDLIKLSSTQSKALRKSVPIVTVIGLKQVLEPNLKQAPASVTVLSGRMTNAKATAPGVSAADLVSVELSSFDQKPIASQVEGKKLKSAMSTVNIRTSTIHSVSPEGGPVETDELVQSKALPKLDSNQLAALPTSELNAEPLALTVVGNDVVLPDMKFKPSIGAMEAKRVSPLMGRKNPKVRLNYIDRLGGSQETEKAVRRALDWFTRNQEKSGSWRGEAGHYTATTGMAMLAYMGWGAKHTEQGPYQRPLAKAVEWMLREEKNGDLRGRSHRGNMYDHGMAAIAMAEAYALTKDKRLLQPLERIVRFTVNAQNPKTGGWRYSTYKENPNDKGDMSIVGWQVMALKSAQMGGIKVPQVAFQRAGNFLRFVGKGSTHGGEYVYLPGHGRSPTMTAEGMFSQQLLGGFPPSHPRMQESVKLIQKNLPNRQKTNYYYWYYGSLAMHQNQGDAWEKWNENLRPILVRNQVRNGNDRVDGSWDPIGQYGPQAGRCVVTAMATLSLEVYYRYLPLSSPEWLKKGK